MTINLSSEALLHLLTEALKENEALEARLHETEEARRKLSREKTALEMKVTNLRRAGLQLWAAARLATPGEKEMPVPKSTSTSTLHIEGSVSLTEMPGKKYPAIPSWMHALKTWQCAADKQHH